MSLIEAYETAVTLSSPQRMNTLKLKIPKKTLDVQVTTVDAVLEFQIDVSWILLIAIRVSFLLDISPI